MNGQKHNLNGQSGTQSPVKTTWSEKMTVLSKFLESPLNFLPIFGYIIFFLLLFMVKTLC